ncbi:MAG: hypothetical protein MUE84_10430, partial [Hyphomonas sp.]|nr:hypothetical protein [Hyphomonas sp.]
MPEQEIFFDFSIWRNPSGESPIESGVSTPDSIAASVWNLSMSVSSVSSVYVPFSSFIVFYRWLSGARRAACRGFR